MRAAGRGSFVGELFDYHFGYGVFGPARRGKRLRPRLLTIVAGTEGATPAASSHAAAAVEMLHNYSLVHDDIEDRDELRHGKPTLWKRYGEAQALNAGDALCAASFLTLARGKGALSPDRVLQMVEVLHEAHAAMCAGQAMDLAFESATSVRSVEYDRMIAGKTAALFGAACELGALCASGDADSARAYRDLGRAYGMAFQIRDDVLGIWGSSQATGKAQANDIARRKWTFPVVWALAQEPSPAREAIAAAYARPAPLDDASVADAMRALDALGARESAERAIESHVERVRDRGAAGDFLIATLNAQPAA